VLGGEATPRREERAAMRRLLAPAALLALTLTSSVSAFAEDPAGFAEFPWGSARRDVVAKLVRDRCSWSVPVKKPQADTIADTIACYGYQLDSVGPVVLNLDFIGDALQGYTIIAPARRLAEFRAWVKKQFGEPASVMQLTGEIASWRWPSGTTAIFREHCLTSTEACVSLSGPSARSSPEKRRRARRPGLALTRG